MRPAGVAKDGDRCVRSIGVDSSGREMCVRVYVCVCVCMLF